MSTTYLDSATGRIHRIRDFAGFDRFCEVRALMAGGFESTQAILSGIVTICSVQEHHLYTIPDYPVIQIQLVHVQISQEEEGEVKVFDAFMRASSPKQLTVPGDIIVKRGFFIHVSLYN